MDTTQIPQPSELLGKYVWDDDERKFDPRNTIWRRDMDKQNANILELCRCIIQDSRERLESSFEPDDGIMDANYCSSSPWIIKANNDSSSVASDMLYDDDEESDKEEETASPSQVVSPFFYT